ncbi:MAG: ketopantoate reductase family protein [Spirochaetota bacterium]
MRVGIIGAGAMGTLFAEYIAGTSVEYYVYEKDENRKNYLNDHLPVASSSSELSRCDIIFFFVKSYATDNACQDIQSFINDDTIIVTLQNGLGNCEIIYSYFPHNPLVLGTTTYGAELDSSGALVPGGEGEIIIGGRDRKSSAVIFSLLTDAGFTTRETGNPLQIIWEKAIINAGINPLGAVLNIPNGKILENEYSSTIQEQLVLEGSLVADAMKLNISGEIMIERTKQVCLATALNHCSMLQDIRSRRKTEIDSINGKIIEYGQVNGIPTPWNTSMYYLVKAMETNIQ